MNFLHLLRIERVSTVPRRGVHVSTVRCQNQPRPLEVEWPESWHGYAGVVETDNTVVLHTFDNLRRVPSTFAMNREEALALSDALRRAALS